MSKFKNRLYLVKGSKLVSKDKEKTQNEVLLSFEEALSELHIDLRTVVWLSDVEEFTQKEISEMLRCPMGTVASRLHRGRRFLRQRLLSYVRNRGIVKE